MKQLFSGFALLALLTSSWDKDDNVSNNIKTITQTVVDNPDFSILEAAIVKANLSVALSSGSYTVFAPDNAAFAASGISEASISAIPVSTLDSLLKYHVLGSKVNASGVPTSNVVTTLSGLNLYASNNANGVFVNGIKVKEADVAASNGVIHVISKVLLPPTRTIAEIAGGDTSFSILVAAVRRAGLLNAISEPGKFTVFAPTNAAFRAAGFNSPADINAAPEDVITRVVKYHVIPANMFAGDFSNGATVNSLEGGSLTVNLAPARVAITSRAAAPSDITATDLVATNGVIHVIDKVLLP